jgi:hypothetical protein
MSWNYGQFDSGTSWQGCYRKADLEKSLSRTGAAPLVIKIDIDLKFWIQTGVDGSELFPIFDTLAKVFNRCDTLKLEGGYGVSDEPEEPWLLESLQFPFSSLQFPLLSSLRCLYVKSGWENTGIVQKLLVACNHESTALQELSIVDPDTGYHRGDRALIRLLANHQFLLERLTSFSAKNIKFPENVIAAMRRLSYFSFCSRNFDLRQLCSISDQLQEVHLLYVTVELGTRQLDNLRKLVLRACHFSEKQKEIKLPVLDTLIFENVTWLPVLMLDCPSLLHLELTWGYSPFRRHTRTDTESEVNHLWSLKQRFAYLKTLKIDLRMSAHLSPEFEIN